MGNHSFASYSTSAIDGNGGSGGGSGGSGGKGESPLSFNILRMLLISAM